VGAQSCRGVRGALREDAAGKPLSVCLHLRQAPPAAGLLRHCASSLPAYRVREGRRCCYSLCPGHGSTVHAGGASCSSAAPARINACAFLQLFGATGAAADGAQTRTGMQARFCAAGARAHWLRGARLHHSFSLPNLPRRHATLHFSGGLAARPRSPSELPGRGLLEACVPSPHCCHSSSLCLAALHAYSTHPRLLPHSSHLSPWFLLLYSAAGSTSHTLRGLENPFCSFFSAVLRFVQKGCLYITTLLKSFTFHFCHLRV